MSKLAFAVGTALLLGCGTGSDPDIAGAMLAGDWTISFSNASDVSAGTCTINDVTLPLQVSSAGQ